MPRSDIETELIAVSGCGPARGSKGDRARPSPLTTRRSRSTPDALELRRPGHRLADEARPEKAIADFSEAIRTDPGFALAYLNRAGVRYEKGEFDKAIADLDAAIRRQPKDAHAYCPG